MGDTSTGIGGFVACGPKATAQTDIIFIFNVFFLGGSSGVPAMPATILISGFHEPLQDLRADILQPAANARDQTVIIQTGGGTTLLMWPRIHPI